MNSKMKGIFLAAFGGSMWGISGIFAQILFNQYAASSEWLVSVRLLVSGILILLYSTFMKKENIFRIMQNGKDVGQLLLFSFVGIIGVQYLFFKAIEVSSASLATILQFTGPIFVYLYMLLRKEKRLNISEMIFVLTTFVGVLLIVTNGKFGQMAVSPFGFLMGIGSAIAVAFYSLQPRKLLAKYGSTVIVGWGMLLAGGVFQWIHPVWQPNFSLDFQSIILIGIVILFGTTLGFLAYLSSLTFIEASLASIMTALEPLLAAILSVVIFQKVFVFFEIMGIVIVLISILLLSRMGERHALRSRIVYNKDEQTVHKNGG